MQDTAKLTENARKFAVALDACDYGAAAEFLAPDCRYHVPNDDVRIGPQAILAAYKLCDARARRDFDYVKYSSEAAVDVSGGVRLTFSDELLSGGSSHTYRCSHIVFFDEEGKIRRIELCEVPGERERLNDFYRNRGVSPG